MINEAVKQITKELIDMRRYLHSIPELEYNEHKTCEFIASVLDKLGIEYNYVLPTGISALIRGKKGVGKTILLRSDIDALPITEMNNISYKSKNEGVMHACGHDAHIAILLGTAMILKKINYDFFGNVKLIFQPAEEGRGGALPMIEKGVLENPHVDCAVALHTDPTADAGTLKYRDGAIMASPDDFYIKLIGKGGHGAYPQKCVNPIIAASQLIKKITESFCQNEDFTVSVCTVNSGTLNNIIPDFAEITGTARSLNNATRTKIERLLSEYTRECSVNNNCSYEFVFNKMYPPLINSAEINRLVVNAAKKIPAVKKICVQEKASMTGDDFSYIAEVVPSSYFKIGTANESIKEMLHSSTFNIDESALMIGAAVLAQTAVDFLNQQI